MQWGNGQNREVTVRVQQNDQEDIHSTVTLQFRSTERGGHTACLWPSKSELNTDAAYQRLFNGPGEWEITFQQDQVTFTFTPPAVRVVLLCIKKLTLKAILCCVP
jgi:hypothetical protein